VESVVGVISVSRDRAGLSFRKDGAGAGTETRPYRGKATLMFYLLRAALKGGISLNKIREAGGEEGDG